MNTTGFEFEAGESYCPWCEEYGHSLEDCAEREDCDSDRDEPGWVTPVTPHNGDPIHDYLADKGRI
jgi:hypothetical protein